MIVCIFEHVQCRWALSDSAALGVQPDACTYSSVELRSLVGYAADRGVRVMFEVDIGLGRMVALYQRSSTLYRIR